MDSKIQGDFQIRISVPLKNSVKFTVTAQKNQSIFQRNLTKEFTLF